MRVTLFTNRYSAFQPAQGVPVRTSLGYPRFPLRYDLVHKVPEITPQRSYLRAPRAEYETAFYAQLNAYGVERIHDTLEKIARAEGDERLVLMCFEDLSKPGLWCHRRLFAAWWTEQTGDPVRELGPTAPEGHAHTQGTLL